MRAAHEAFVGALGFDTIVTIDAAHATKLAAWGMKFAVRYLGSLSSVEVDTLHDAGLAVMPVTYGGAFNGDLAVAQLRAAGIAPGTTVWLDLEGQGGKRTPVMLVTIVNEWAAKVKAAGYDPGLYVGWDAVLTSTELYALSVDRYWHALSRLSDRNGDLSEPSCGWCMYQLYPSITVGGVLVDVDVIQKDYKNRLPMWCAKAP